MVNNESTHFPFTPDDLIEMRSYDASDRLEYQGFAPAGSAVSSPCWQIKKFTYDSTSERITTKLFAGSVNDYVHVWDDRATYTYG